MPTLNRLNAYRIMWIYVFFDLPVDSKNDVRAANKFRKILLQDGFTMFQYSIYIRHCTSRENAKVHEHRIKKSLPTRGKICILTVTDRQFGMMEVFHGEKTVNKPQEIQQLELF